MVGLDAPLLRVSRPVAACSRCRSAKVKCDGKLPACSACERAGKSDECSSTSDEFAKGKERNYVATLEMRIEKLEGQIKTARDDKERRKSTSGTLEPDTTINPRRGSESPQSTRGGKAALKKEASNIDDLVSDFGFLAVNATAQDYRGFTAPTSYTRIVLSAGMKTPIPTNARNEIPPWYKAQPLIQHFLTNIFVFYPVFEEASLYCAIDAVYQTQPKQPTPYDLWNVRTMLAIACASRSSEHGDPEYMDAVGHISAALEEAELVLRPGSINSVQSMLLLVLYSMLDPYHFDSWAMLGVASRAMVDLGLHQSTSKSTPTTKRKHATRRRVFWCLYVLDRSISLAQGRSFSFSDESCTVGSLKAIDCEKFNSQRRQEEDDNGYTEEALAPVLFMQPITPAIALAELRRIQSKFYMDIFQAERVKWTEPLPYIRAQLESMQKWWHELPNSIPTVCKDFLELEMLYSSIYLLKRSPRMPTLCGLARAALFEFASSFAAKMFRLLYSARTGDTVRAAPLTYLDVIKIYTCGKELLDVLQFDENAMLFPSTLKAQPDSALPQLVPSVSSRTADLNLPGVKLNATPNAGRAISCISMFDDSLGWLGERFGSCDAQAQFQRDARPLLEELHSWKKGIFQKAATPQSSNVYASAQASSSQPPRRLSSQDRDYNNLGWS